jgi:hypothetical protein
MVDRFEPEDEKLEEVGVSPIESQEDDELDEEDNFWVVDGRFHIAEDYEYLYGH